MLKACGIAFLVLIAAFAWLGWFLAPPPFFSERVNACGFLERRAGDEVAGIPCPPPWSRAKDLHPE